MDDNYKSPSPPRKRKKTEEKPLNHEKLDRYKPGGNKTQVEQISTPENKNNSASNNKSNELPHYLGHRQRLRDRFSSNADYIPDYELLELILFRSVVRGDVKQQAKTLIARFGSFSEVVLAPKEQLEEIKGVGPAIVHDLKLIEQASRRISLGAIKNRQVLSSYNSVVDYCRTAMGFSEIEEFRILLLDKKNGLIGDEKMQRGTVDHTPVYPREIIRRALQLNASAIILVHNHPSGDTTPSRADIEMTREIVSLSEPLGITIHDHLIVGRKGHTSFRALGLI